MLRLPPAPRAASVAKVSATTPPRHSTSPSGSSPWRSRTPMISTTPRMPATSPSTAIGRSRSPCSAHPRKATTSGIIEPMIAAADASTRCIATQFSPR